MMQTIGGQCTLAKQMCANKRVGYYSCKQQNLIISDIPKEYKLKWFLFGRINKG